MRNIQFVDVAKKKSSIVKLIYYYAIFYRLAGAIQNEIIGALYSTVDIE